MLDASLYPLLSLLLVAVAESSAGCLVPQSFTDYIGVAQGPLHKYSREYGVDVYMPPSGPAHHALGTCAPLNPVPGIILDYIHLARPIPQCNSHYRSPCPGMLSVLVELWRYRSSEPESESTCIPSPPYHSAPTTPRNSTEGHALYFVFVERDHAARLSARVYGMYMGSVYSMYMYMGSAARARCRGLRNISNYTAR